IDDPNHRDRTEEDFAWVTEKFHKLVPVIKWNHAIFTDHGTYIIGFSVSKKHMAVVPEQYSINYFTDGIVQMGYDHTNALMRIKWNSSVDFSLLEKMIEFNISDKAGYTTFWRE